MSQVHTEERSINGRPVTMQMGNLVWHDGHSLTLEWLLLEEADGLVQLLRMHSVVIDLFCVKANTIRGLLAK